MNRNRARLMLLFVFGIIVTIGSFLFIRPETGGAGDTAKKEPSSSGKMPDEPKDFLKELRDDIDQDKKKLKKIDNELAELFRKKKDITHKLVELKVAHGCNEAQEAWSDLSKEIEEHRSDSSCAAHDYVEFLYGQLVEVHPHLEKCGIKTPPKEQLQGFVEQAKALNRECQ